MAVKTFSWSVERDSSPTVEYKTVETVFGDGYTQVSAEGINNKNESYSIKTNAKEAVALQIMAFFEEHKGVKSFLWKPPLQGFGLYRCTDPAALPQGGGLYVITGTFVRAYASMS